MPKSTKIVKQSFEVLRDNKRLVKPYLWLYGATTVVFLAVMSLIVALNKGTVDPLTGETVYETSLLPFTVLVPMLMPALLGHMAEGYVIHAALQKFRTGKIDWAQSAGALRQRAPAILKFGFLSTLVGSVLSFFEDSLPFTGAISAALFNGAWSVASAFAVPVIMDSQHNLGPIDATKESVGVIRHKFGENARLGLGTGIVLGLIMAVWIVASMFMVAAPIFNTITDSSPLEFNSFILPGVVVALSGFVLFTVISTVKGILRAALYHYVVADATPKGFEQDMFKAVITTKKASKLFGA